MATQKSNLTGKGVRTIANGEIVRIRVVGPRKQFVVTNLQAAGSGSNLYITGPDEVPALVALPQLPISLETDSEFRLRNDSGVTITYVVGELFNIGLGFGSNSSKGASSYSGRS